MKSLPSLTYTRVNFTLIIFARGREGLGTRLIKYLISVQLSLPERLHSDLLERDDDHADEELEEDKGREAHVNDKVDSCLGRRVRLRPNGRGRVEWGKGVDTRVHYTVSK